MVDLEGKTYTGWRLDNSYGKLPGLLYSMVEPVPVSSPKLVVLNFSLARKLGLNIQDLLSNDGVEILAGNKLPRRGIALAQAYAGHQFGHFTILGDGRAMLLGEQITPQGARFDIQLKGSGRTPYSRTGDGRAALGPMLREYIISEGMHNLGIPTSRSLAVVTSGEKIVREKNLLGAILTRVASSHIRVGTFEYLAKLGSPEELKALADYAIQRHYPYIVGVNAYLNFLREVIMRQAKLIAKWQLVGFIHGVMNTDNMTISGETIDYGPCAFMDTYDPKRVFSSIDVHGRYSYGNQAKIAEWNLAVFAESLLTLIHKDSKEAVRLAQAEVAKFKEIFHLTWLRGMRDKLGIFAREEDDDILINDLLDLMFRHRADYTKTFLALTFNNFEGEDLFKSDQFKHWHKNWEARLKRQGETREKSHLLMRNSNPAVIPRNHRVEEVLESAVEENNYKPMEKLLSILSNPYLHLPEQAEYANPPISPNPNYRTFCGT